MDKTIKKYLSVLLEGATKNLAQMDEYIESQEEQLKNIKANRMTIVEDIKELEGLVGDGVTDEEGSTLELIKD